MEAVHGSVDGHRHVLLAHLVEQRRHSGGGDVRGTRRDRLADVANICAILIARILVAQFFEHLAAARVLASFVAVLHKDTPDLSILVLSSYATVPLDFRHVFREERARLEEHLGSASVEKEAFPR